MKGDLEMKNYCPFCNKNTKQDLVKEKEILDIKGDSIEVDSEYFKCKECNNEFEDQSSNYDPVFEAYEKYRLKHKMVQPKEIKEFRKRYNLTQKDLSKILGWGGATISRYENGALQDETHDNLLKLIMNPINLLDLLNKNPNVLNTERRKKLIEKLHSNKTKSNIIGAFIDFFEDFEKDIFNGFKIFNRTLIFNVMAFFCKEEVFKTKLNRRVILLFFFH